LKFFQKYSAPLTQEEKRRRNKEWLLLILSGLMLGVSFTPFPFPFTLLIFIAFIPYFIVLENRTSLVSISRATFIFTFVFSVFTLYWVGSWQSSADTFLMMGGAALLLVYPCVFLIPSTLYYLAKKIFPKINALYFFPLFWVTAEFLLTLTDLRFPWVLLGHGLAKFNLFIQGAEIVGTFGLSVAVAYINIFLYKSYKNYKASRKLISHALLTASILFATFIIYGMVRTSTFNISERKIKVGLVQPDLNPWDKWETGNLNDLLNLYLEQSTQAVEKGAQIILWPETALPVYALGGRYPKIADKIFNFIEEKNVGLLTGMPDIRYYFNKEKIPEDAKHSEKDDFHYATYNSVILLVPGSRDLQRYGKMKLVPLGEQVPFVEQFAFLGDFLKWGVGISGWNVGKDTTVFNLPLNNSEDDTIKISGLVCFESVFPVFVTNFVQKGAELIAVVTNDSWYGKSSGPYQHKEFGALRAIENRRSVVRCANGGISCLINALGETVVETEMFTKAVLVVDVPLQTEETFYTNNPLIFPLLSSVFSFWVFGMNILIWLKKKFKL
jgi:apolipoprotein N-acyltransferase